MSTSREQWVIVLAGGEGSRLMNRIVLGKRVDRPKQFCRFGDERSLLRATIERALWLAEPERIVLVVLGAHRDWWNREIFDLPGMHVIEQPGNRGTGVAILQAVLHILQYDADPLLAVLPSDHGVVDEDVVVRAVKAASRLTTERRVTLLGMEPDLADAGYGWIVPGREPGPLRSVRAFVEKPSRPTASALMRHGALWNSFILTGRGLGLVDLFRRTQPAVLHAFLENLLERGSGSAALSALYPRLEPLDFSRDVLEHVPEWLNVLPVEPCGWTDLGTPQRLNEWLVQRFGREAPVSRALVPIDAW